MTTASLDYPSAIQAEIGDYCRLLGEELTDGYAFNRVATGDAIRHFAWGIGDDNPLWTDEGYGGETQYGGLVAPPMWIYSCYQAGGLGLPSFTGLHIGTEWTFNQMVKAGDEIQGVHVRTELSPKPVRHAKRALYQATLNRYTNQHGEVVAERLLKELRFLPQDIAQDHYMTQPRPTYTEDELRRITDDYTGETCQGSTPRYWEDVEVGDDLPMIVKGPFTPRDSIAYYMGIGSRSHVAHKGFWIELRRTHPRPHNHRSRDGAARRTADAPRQGQHGPGPRDAVLLRDWPAPRREHGPRRDELDGRRRLPQELQRPASPTHLRR